MNVAFIGPFHYYLPNPGSLTFSYLEADSSGKMYSRCPKIGTLSFKICTRPVDSQSLFHNKKQLYFSRNYFYGFCIIYCICIISLTSYANPIIPFLFNKWETRVQTKFSQEVRTWVDFELPIFKILFLFFFYSTPIAYLSWYTQTSNLCSH